MKKLSILIFVVLLIFSVSAFSFEDILDIRKALTANVVVNRDPSVTLSRPVDTQVVTNPVNLKFRYFDAEDDEMTSFILQIDDDHRFFSPQNYQGVGTEFKLTLDEGLYYWRVKVVNDNGDALSEPWQFYVDPTVKICDDGTLFFECASDKPFFCSAGTLREDCQRCGCELSATCEADGSCFKSTCSDGTAYSDCALNQPTYCANGELKEVCSLCGCEEGLECLADGTCDMRDVEVMLDDEETGSDSDLSFLERVASFFKRLFFG